MSAGGIHRTRLTGDVGDAVVANWLKPIGIRSVQSFTIDTSAVTTATITAVDTANSFVMFLGSTSDTATAVNRDMGRIVLTNSTTVTATLSSSTNLIISGMVVQCWPGVIKSIQPGTITISTAVTTGTLTITSVQTEKSFIAPGGFSGNIGDATGHDASTARLALTNATTVTMTLGAAAGGGGGLAVVGAFTVVEFF